MTKARLQELVNMLPDDGYYVCVIFCNDTVEQWINDYRVSTEEVIDMVNNDVDWSNDFKMACKEAARELLADIT